MGSGSVRGCGCSKTESHLTLSCDGADGGNGSLAAGAFGTGSHDIGCIKDGCIIGCIIMLPLCGIWTGIIWPCWFCIQHCGGGCGCIGSTVVGWPV